MYYIYWECQGHPYLKSQPTLWWQTYAAACQHMFILMCQTPIYISYLWNWWHYDVTLILYIEYFLLLSVVLVIGSEDTTFRFLSRFSFSCIQDKWMLVHTWLCVYQFICMCFYVCILYCMNNYLNLQQGQTWWPSLLIPCHFLCSST